MEILAVFFILVLAVLVIGSIMGILSAGRISKLEQQNRNLNERLKRLETRGDVSEASTPEPSVPVAPEAPAIKPIRKPIPEMGLQSPRIAASAVGPKMSVEKIETAKAASWSPLTRSQPKKPARNLEELIGGQWSVWVGGFALLVGAVLLIRFSIEAGIFGPGARILMALVLGCLLLAAGEWLKRSDDKVLEGKLGEAAKALQDNASVPGLLSAVGIFTLLGTIYAAHALYGFISAPVAFVALGVTAIGAMALSLRQGPLLAAIGLVASMATPLLIQTETPSFVALVGYLLVIGFAALALARRTGWRWLETATVFGWLGWAAMSMKAATSGQMVLWGVFLLIGFVVTIWQAERSEPNAAPAGASKGAAVPVSLDLNPILAFVWSALAGWLIVLIAGDLLRGSPHIPQSAMILSSLSLAALLAASVVMKRQSGHLIIAGVLAIILLLMSGRGGQGAVFAFALAVSVILALRLALIAKDNPASTAKQNIWPIAAVGLGLTGICLSKIEGPVNWSDTLHAGWALVYSVFYGAVAVYFHAKARPKIMTTILCVGASLAWAIAAIMSHKVTLGVEPEGLIFFLKMAVGAGLSVAAIWRLNLPGARLGLIGLSGLSFAMVFLAQFPHAARVSALPIFNELWIYLALPAAILAAAGYILHRRDETSDRGKILNAIIEAAALAGLALFVVFQIRHLSNGGAVYADTLGFTELGLQVSTGLCFTLAGLSKRFSGNLVLSKMAELISYVTLSVFALGSLFGLSPFFNRSETISGNVVFNSLTTGLLVPTALLALCAWRARGRRPAAYVNILGGLALLGGMSWVTATIRYIYNGSPINIYRVNFGDLELWTISAVWLLIGIALLVLGVWRKDRALRMASGVVIILTVLKAFLIDMAGLEGVLRALSFVALGLILIVIGRAYQRYWLSGSGQEKLESADAPT